MDFRQSIQPSANRPAPAPAPVAPERKEEKAGRKTAKSGPEWLRVLTVILLACITVVLIGVIVASMRSDGGNGNENKLVDKSKYQAVFLNNGQVYFGYIKDLNNGYIRMTNIYYLTQGSTGSSSSSSSSNYSLVKLGCQQIHDPLDEMVINRDQVTFWENLNPGGKVVTSIKQFQQQNPNGPDCSQVSSQTQAGSNTGDTQGAGTNTGTSTGDTTNK